MVTAATVATLDDVCVLIVDCEHKTAPTQSEGYPSIRTPNIGRGRLLLDGVNRVSEETYRLWTQRAVPQAGDLILAREAPIGNVAIVPQNLKVCLGQRTVLIRPNKQLVDPMYLVYLLLGDEIQGRIQSLSNGATVHHLNMADIHSLALPQLPPLSTQRKIAAVLTAYDDLIENNTRRIALLEEIARTLYREWFVEFRYPGREGAPLVESPLGAIPQGWRVVKLGEAVEIRRGRSYASVNLVDEGGLPFVNLKCVDRDGGFRRDGLKRYSGPFKESQLVGAGDIVIAVTDMTQERRIVARAARIPKLSEAQSVFSMDLVSVVPQSGVSREYLYGMLRYSDFADSVKQAANGANVLHLNPDRIEEFVFALPSASLIARYGDYCRKLFEECDTLQAMNDNLRRTRDLLLPKLVSGEVDVERIEIETGG